MPGDINREPTDLDPKTLEVWAGIRSLTTRSSLVQDEIDGLRAQLSGFAAYKTFLKSQDSFDRLEASLTTRVGPVAEISADDVTETVTLLSDNFADWGTYRGDGSSGTLSQADYDAYRTFLTSNGIATVAADEHIQLLKSTFDPDAGFDSDVSEHESWDTLETELENNGVASSTAADVVDTLQATFPSVAAFDRIVIASTSYAEVNTALQESGLSSSEASDTVAALKTAYGSTLGETQKDFFAAFDSFSEFESYLSANGFSSQEVDTLQSKIQNEYSNFATFRTRVLGIRGALETLLSDTSYGTSTGDEGIGLRFFEEAGTTISGTSTIAGAVSLRGAELHFEQLGYSPGTDDGTVLSFSGISLSKPVIVIGEETRASVTVQNTGSSATSGVTIPLTVNGAVVARKKISLDAGEVTTVSFTITGTSVGLGKHSIRIGESGSAILRVEAGLL